MIKGDTGRLYYSSSEGAIPPIAARHGIPCDDDAGQRSPRSTMQSHPENYYKRPVNPSIQQPASSHLVQQVGCPDRRLPSV